MTIYETIGQQLCKVRKAHGLSQSELGKILGVTPNTISRWETGTYRIQLEDLEKICTYLAMDIGTFFAKTPHYYFVISGTNINVRKILSEESNAETK